MILCKFALSINLSLQKKKMKKLLKQVGWFIAIIVVVCVIIMLFTGIIQGAMTYLSAAKGVALSDDVLYGVSGTLALGMAALLLCFIVLQCHGLSFYTCSRPVGIVWQAVFILLIFALCRVVLPGVWAYTAGSLGAQPSDTITQPGESLWMMILFGVILAPIFEELLFRKVLFALLLKRFSLCWTIVLTSIMFAISHGLNVHILVSSFVAGLLFAILMKQSGSLLACIIAHMLCNFEALCYNMMEKNGSSLIVEFHGQSTYCVAVVAVGFIVMLFCIGYLYRCYQQSLKL